MKGRRSIQYSLHRFVVSDPRKLGLSTERWMTSKIIKIRTVDPDTFAMRHGIEIDDEILWPSITSTSGPKMDVQVVSDLLIRRCHKEERDNCCHQKAPIDDV